MKKEISHKKIVFLVKENYIKACRKLPVKVVEALKKALDKKIF